MRINKNTFIKTFLIVMSLIFYRETFSQTIDMESCKDNARNMAAILKLESLCSSSLPPPVKIRVREMSNRCSEKYIYGDKLFNRILSDEKIRLNNGYLKFGEEEFCKGIPDFIDQVINSSKE